MQGLKLRKYLKVTANRIQDRLAYKSSFLAEVFFYALLIFMFSRLWEAVYTRQPEFLGLSRPQLIWYVVLTEFIALSSAKVFHVFAGEIKAGSISYQLLRPYDYILYQLADMSGTLLIKMLFNAIVAGLLVIPIAGPLAGFSPACLPFLAAVFAASFLLDFFIQTCLGLTAFWLEENIALYWIYSKLALVLGMLLPQDVFHPRLQFVMRFLPWRYLHYGPARLTIGFSLELWKEIITGQLIFLVLSIALSYLIFTRGKRKVVHNGG